MSISNKKVLITGGAGFIGANFVYKFLELGCKVDVVEKNGANIWRIEKVKDKINLYSLNLTNYDETEKFISEIKPNIVIHFAAYGAYQRFQQDVEATISTNLIGSINLINACHKIGVECFVNTGTNSEYGIKKNPMKETDVLEADNLYAITKVASTLYCQMMAKKFNFPVVTIRPFAVYGYFEEKERLIPTIIKSCLTNTKLELSRPDSVRDYIFIEDLISAYLLAIKNIKKVKGEVFNVGSGKQNTIADVVKTIKNITKSKVKPEYGQMKIAQTEPKIWVSNISKAKNVLKWEPKYDLENGLIKDIDWFKNNLSSYEN
ncbi:MAG: nucleoside-diphosphate-sugar epimerase [Parcubacteria group bacterium Licking1014_1]|nr:MAG: nucleoside-diphosphate-sugar epimerase [Parcubacteria group bacterium Licking1014_1]